MVASRPESPVWPAPPAPLKHFGKPNLAHPGGRQEREVHVKFLFEYGLFLAQAVTVVVSIAAVLILAIGLTRRGGKTDGLEVMNLNQHYENMSTTLERAVLTKKDFKARAKAKKADDKAAAKAKAKTEKQHRSAPATTDPDAHEAESRHRLYVIDFQGDLKASGSSALREEVTAVLTIASERDEVLVRIENGGGMVHGHGLAASQLARLRERGIPLTVAIDKIAASGGYMMACVANHILAAPFAIVGSIGVLAQIPNFNRLLDRAGVDFEQVKAGEHKRTLTLFGKNTEEDREKMQHDIEHVHELFKRFVTQYRPALDIEAVATGEHWFGSEARERRLVDDISTSDDYLLNAAKSRDVYSVRFAEKPGLSERLASAVSTSVYRVVDRLVDWNTVR